ncbi:MAG: APC family permease [Formosimonas sp.]
MTLKRNISMRQGVILAIGMVLGSGLFGLPGLAIEQGGPDAALMGWLLMAFVMSPMLYVFITLGQAYPQADGLTQYAQVAIAGNKLESTQGRMAKGAVSALLAGTFALGIPASLWVAASYVLNAFTIESQSAHVALTAIFLLASTLMNLRGVTILAKINAISLYVLLAVVALLIIGNLDTLHTTRLQVQLWHVADFTPQALWAVMALLFWAFLGWENMSFGLGELHDPKRNIPRVYAWSFLCVIALYITLAAVMSGAAWQGRPVAGESGLLALFHTPWLRFILGITMGLMMISSQNAWIFGASRMLYSGANEGFFPRSWASLNAAQMPERALWLLFCAFTLALLLLTTRLISVAQMMTLVSQNFMVLYAVSLLAYWRIIMQKPSIIAVLMGLVASASCVFLLQGFTWWLLFPIILLLLGCHLARQKA